MALGFDLNFKQPLETATADLSTNIRESPTIFCRKVEKS
jgi:hypothetical protein